MHDNCVLNFTKISLVISLVKCCLKVCNYYSIRKNILNKSNEMKNRFKFVPNIRPLL